MKRHFFVGYFIACLGIFACVIGWKFSEFDRWMVKYTAPATKILYLKLNDIAVASDAGYLVTREGYSLEVVKSKLIDLKTRIESLEQTYVSENKKSPESFVLMALIFLTGVFYIYLGYGIIRGREISRRALPISVALTTLAALSMVLWSYFYTTTITTPILRLAIEIAEHFSLELKYQLLSIFGAKDVSSWALFKQTMIGPNVLMAGFLLFMFELLPWIAIKQLPTFHRGKKG